MDSKSIAGVCHEANREMTRLLKDVPLQPPWVDAPEEMAKSAINGVEWRLKNPNAPAAAQHDEWVRAKVEDGWKLGPKRDANLKTHPALVAYEDLPRLVKLKDALFTSIVLALKD